MQINIWQAEFSHWKYLGVASLFGLIKWVEQQWVPHVVGVEADLMRSACPVIHVPMTMRKGLADRSNNFHEDTPVVTYLGRKQTRAALGNCWTTS